MKRFLALLLALLMLLSLASCGKSEDDASQQTDPEPSSEAKPEPTAAEIYTEAAQKVLDKTDFRLSADISKYTKAGTQVFKETHDLTVKTNGAGTEGFTSQVSDIVNFGTDHSVVVSEIYQNGMIYGDMDGCRYTAEISGEAFAVRYVPAVLLDASLYTTIEFTDDTTISFSGASALESWMAGEGCELIGAMGTAVLDETGALVSTTYDVTYSVGSVVMELVATVQIADYTAQVEVPTDTTGYIALAHPDVPMLLERGYGYLLQSNSVSSSIHETVVSAGVQAIYTGQTQVELYGKGMDMIGQADYNHQMTDIYGNPLWTSVEQESYADGAYVYSLDGQSETYPVTTEAVAKDLRDGFMDLLADNAPTLSDLESVSLTVVSGGNVLDYTFSQSYQDALKDYACGVILNDPGLLDSLATAYTVQQAEGYMALDAVTGLPTAYSIAYTGTHTIDGTDYVLSLQTSQRVDAASMDAYTALTGEPEPSQEPVETPAPLFYHVTGPDGEEMWLLGTIHVGDRRTANLPQQIYDAFAASDALAVEFDINSFMEQLENNPELAQSYLLSVMYTDGSTISGHLEDEMLYEQAKQTLKFTGEYTANAELMKPTLWSQSIETFYLRLGYALTSDFGVDMQLLNMAQEQEKTVLNVESGMEQVQMLTGFSDALQEYLLASTLSYTPAAYYGDVHRMYELWCAGDEAALIEMVAPRDTSDMTAEELALHEEYTKAMERDRNVQMLDVAKGYLSSGDTVFYAVGLAHLLAEDGLVNTLRAAGYTVELVSYE